MHPFYMVPSMVIFASIGIKPSVIKQHLKVHVCAYINCEPDRMYNIYIAFGMTHVFIKH